MFRKLPGLGMSNMNFLIADVRKFVSGTVITFSQGGAAKIKSEELLEFGSQTTRVAQGKISKCPVILRENSGNLVSQKCGHPEKDAIRFSKSKNVTYVAFLLVFSGYITSHVAWENGGCSSV